MLRSVIFAMLSAVLNLNGVSYADEHIDFGCPATGCPPPGTGQFGCPATGCVSGAPSHQESQIVYAANGATYRFYSSNVVIDLRTGMQVRVISVSDDTIFLSDGNYIYVRTQNSARATGSSTSSSQPIGDLSNQESMLVRAADGAIYRLYSSNVAIDQRTGGLVHVVAATSEKVFLSDGNYLYIRGQNLAQSSGSSVSSSPSASSQMLRVGSLVRALRNVNMYVGTEVTGQIFSDVRFRVYKIQSPWVALMDENQVVQSGWVLENELLSLE